jgi:hydrogenase nickel incorporation protein HypA/HybF
MHELSIAMGIVDGVREELAAHGESTVVAVHVRLGRFSGVDAEALLFSYDAACEGTPLEGSQLRIDVVDGREMLITGMELES